MDKMIDVFGDSHTYGDGMPDCGLANPWIEHSSLTWPYHMFDAGMINNYAYSGASNDTITMRLVRHAIQKNIVLIMFTYPERLHIIRKGYNFVVTHNGIHSISDNGDENWVAKQIAKSDVDRHKKYLLENYDDAFLEINFLRNILSCQNFCESNGLEYYFTIVSMRPKIEMRGSLEKYRDSIYNSINWKNIFLVEGKYGFDEYAEKIKASKANNNSHWGEQYHKVFGKLFFDWIGNKKQV
jgi:hypothetical protein